MGNTYSSTTVIGGTYDKEYEPVKNMFKKNFETGKERDSQLCVYVEGRRVVDLWGSAEGDLTYNGDSLQCVFSCSKAITAIAISSLADQGLLNYSNPVSSYFPEFAVNQKEKVRLEDVLRHEAGLANLHTSIHPKMLHDEELQKGTVANIIANDYQVFPENTTREYHSLTGGWILNEIVRRVTPDKSTLGSIIRRDFYDRLGLDIHLGVKDPEISRVRPLRAMTSTQAILHSLIPNAFGAQVEHNIFVFGKMMRSINKKFLENEKIGMAPSFAGVDPKMDIGKMVPLFFGGEDWIRGESPHGSVHASARALAKLASAMAHEGSMDGVAVISPSAWSLLHANPIVRPDAFMGMCRTEFTQGGVNVYRDYHDDKIAERILKSGRDGYIGWQGFGGSVIQWHPQLRIGFGYACTFMTWWDLANIKARKLQKEVVQCVKARNKLVDENNKASNKLVDENNNMPENLLNANLNTA